MTAQISRTASRAFAVRTVFAAALLTCVASVANAHEGCETKTVTAAALDVPAVAVSYKDLNLATAEGNRTLYRRIVAAAGKVCPATPAPGSRLASRNRACLDEAISRAVNDTKSAQLAELDAARNRRDVRS